QTQSHGWKAIEGARTRFLDWARALGFVVFRVEYVATFEPWDDGTGVYVFFNDDAALSEAKNCGFLDRAKEAYLTFLREEGYPFSTHPKVVFEFDSDENVRKNFEGNYFFRLR